MTVLAGEMSSESDDRSVLAPAETKAQGLSKQSKITYTRSFLVSVANSSKESRLPRGIEQSVLSDFELLDCRLDKPGEASNDAELEITDSERFHDSPHNGLLSSENVDLLGPGSVPEVHGDIAGSVLEVHGDIAGASQPIIEEYIAPLLHKCKEPYRPPHLCKSDWNDYKDELWVSPECPSKNEGQKQHWRRDLPETMKEGQKETFQEKAKKSSSEHDKFVSLIMPMKFPKYDDIINSSAAQCFDSPAHSRSPAACCSEFTNQFPAIEQKPAYGISCTEGSILKAHGVSNEHSTKVPDNHLKSTIDETSQLYGCKIPAVILGVLACVGLEHIFKPETKEFSCSMLWDGCRAEDDKQDSSNHNCSHHLMLLPEERTEQTDMTAPTELTIASDELLSDSMTDNNKLQPVTKADAGECEKDLTAEPFFGTSSPTGFQSTGACTYNRLTSVGRSTRKNVSQTCKFFFPIAKKNHLASATRKYKLSVIDSEAIVFSSTTEQSKRSENWSVSDALKHNPVSCSDVKDSLPIELCLPDEDSLITVEDFRVVSYKDMLERNQVKADMVSPSAPVDSSRKPMDTKAGTTDDNSTDVKSVAPAYKGKSSYRASPALINSQVKAVNPKFKPQNPSNQAFPTNVFSTNFVQSQAKPHQQMFTTTYMPELYQVQSFPWNYQMSGYGCVPLTMPTPGLYGGTNLLGTQSNAGTSYHLGWQ